MIKYSRKGGVNKVKNNLQKKTVRILAVASKKMAEMNVNTAI